MTSSPQEHYDTLNDAEKAWVTQDIQRSVELWEEVGVETPDPDQHLRTALISIEFGVAEGLQVTWDQDNKKWIPIESYVPSEIVPTYSPNDPEIYTPSLY